MLRVALGLAFCAAFLTACANYSAPVSQPVQPDGKPVLITLQVEAHLNRYYRSIGGGRNGAFAVSRKGTVGFYAYCKAIQCREEIDLTKEALKGCEDRAHSPCILLAVGRSVRQRYMTYKAAEDQGAL